MKMVSSMSQIGCRRCRNAIGVLGLLTIASLPAAASAQTFTLSTATIEDVNAGFDSGTLTSERLVELYDRRLQETDSQLARLLEALDDDCTLIVITSDHGEGLGFVGPRGHGNLFDHNLLVPLIVRFPGAAAGQPGRTGHPGSIGVWWRGC